MTERRAYAEAGVDYDALDEGKRAALARTLATSALLAARGGRAHDASRGEPAFVFDFAGRHLAFVVEGLGTKSIVARQVEEQTGSGRFDAVAYDTVAAIVNDLCCVGALPLVVNAYFATGSSDWYRTPQRASALMDGWLQACRDAGATWGGGESPTLPELVAGDDIELAGAAVGAVPEGRAPILGDALAPGDEIVLVASSGLHANGASLARLVAARLPGGWATPVGDGTPLGEAILAPSVLYAGLVEALLAEDLQISYFSHITGHGFLKVMRPPRPLTYRLHELPPVPPVLAFLAEQTEMTDHDAYSTLNMGAGWAVYCRPGDGARVVATAERLGHRAWLSGTVEAGPRQVVLEPLGITLGGEELRLAPEGDQPLAG